MKCTVVVLRKCGRVLRSAELEAPTEGDLEVTDFGNSKPERAQRFLRVAYLRTDDNGTRTYMRQALPPLFEPKVVALKGRELILEGIQFACEGANGPLHEHVQVWQCKLS